MCKSSAFGVRLSHAAAVAAALLVMGASTIKIANAAGPYRVGPGDTLLITAYGDPGLSGQFVVAPDGTIGYPMLGPVSVANLATTDIDTAINDRIRQFVPGRTVTVTVSAYAPVFILGDIDRPGRYDFRPGMTALELVAMSGGDRRSKDVVEGAEVQLVSARQEYSDLAVQIFANQVRRARFVAELDATEFAFTAKSDSGPTADQDVRDRIVDAEMTLFKIRKDNLASQKTSLEGQQQSFAEEVKALEGRLALHSGEIDLLQKDVDASKKLVDRGLASQSNLREIERQLSASQRDGLELQSYLARAKQGELDLVQRQAGLTENMQAEAATGIREIDLDTIRKQKQMASILERMAAISSAADALRAREIKAKLQYSIVRQDGARFDEMVADELTELKPRDILRARLVIPDAPALASAGPNNKVN